jgi:choline-sulfatase
MRPQNLLFIFSDQHDPQYLGAAGHTLIRTPNFDRLAAMGTRFTRASTTSPICVPARASLATGRFVHDIHMWDNAFPYDGSIPSWGHRLIQRGHRVTAIGKLHYRSDADDNGFSEKIDTMNVVEGVGDRLGWLRKHRSERGAARQLAEMAGRGESTYTEYDRRVAKEACNWLEERGAKRSEPPWLLFVGFVMPHLPLIAPPAFYDLYADTALPPPRLYSSAERPDHPWLNELTKVLPYDKYFDPERRKKAMTAYYGMVSLLDHHVGMLLDALEKAGLRDSTRIIYTSDHGEMLGNHGVWGKCCMYEEAVSVPMLMAGDGVPENEVATSEASLVDCYPTILDAFGIPETEQEADTLPGRSLFNLIRSPDPNRLGFSEYHAVGAMSGAFMVRRGRWKYMHYAGLPPQLFDLEADPYEAKDLARDPAHKDAVQAMARELRMIVDPDRASADAFADQEAKIEAHGGVAAVSAVGDFGHTPTPGETPHFAKSPEA